MHRALNILKSTRPKHQRLIGYRFLEVFYALMCVFLFGGRIVGHNWSLVPPLLVGVGAMKKVAATSVKRGGGQPQMPRVYSVKASDSRAGLRKRHIESS